MYIKEVAQRCSLPAKTVRYYEEIGLVRPRRDENGYRTFSETDSHNLAFLARTRSLGFSIENCREMLALYQDRKRASADVKEVATQHLDCIERKLAELHAIKATLENLIADCKDDDRPRCPILNDLAGAGE